MPDPSATQGTAGGVAQIPMNDLSNDPFLTHAPAVQRTAPGGTSEMGGMVEAPNLAGDPFMTHGAGNGPPGNRADTVKMQTRFNMSRFVSMLGEPDPSRRPKMLRTLVFVPWALFVWTLLLWLLMRHYSYGTTVFITVLITVASASAVFAWVRGAVSRTVSIGSLGLLCLIAVCLGVSLGMLGWNLYWRQYWWSQTGARYVGNTANTPAGSQTDAAVVSFVAPGTTQLLGGTSVDYTRAAGYKDGHLYCAAPVLSPVSTASGLARVNFWAIGIDCCQPLGGFTCDDSRNYLGNSGVVLLDGGYPCPNCNVDKFGEAIAKAEAAFGLVSAAGSLRVRWVESPGTAIFVQGMAAILYLILCCLASVVVFFCLGWLVWYKGIGKTVADPDLAEGSSEKRSPNVRITYDTKHQNQYGLFA